MISVVGSGRAAGPPEVMRVQLAATVTRPTVAAALAAAEETAAAIRAALARRGVDGADAATAGLSVQAEQVWSEQAGPRITGYRSDHQLALTLRVLDAAGRVLGEALAAGGDQVRLDHVGFEVEDATALRERARELAWQDALRRAGQLAELAGRSLGAVQEIAEQAQEFGGPPRPMMTAARMAADATTEIGVEPGSVAVQVSLAVQWSLD